MEKFWPWLAATAIGIMLPVGLALTGAINFWVGVALIVLACVIAASYPWIGWKNWERKGRVRASIAAIVVCAICLFLVFSPAPLSVLINAVPGSYPEGEMVRGIIWKSEYFPVEILVKNDSPDDYNAINMFIRTNRPITKVGFERSIAQCTAEPRADPSLEIFSPTLSFQDSTGKQHSIPLFRSGEGIAATFFNIKCDKLAADAKVEMTLAVVGGEVRWAVLSADYVAKNLTRARYFPTCFSEQCGRDMPKTFQEMLEK